MAENNCMPDEHQQLLSRIAAGEETALHSFYQAYEQRVFAFALKRLNDHFEAADVLNDVMMQVWRSAGRFEGRSKISTWVLGIAHHKILDKLRQRKRTEHDELDLQVEDENEISATRVIEAAQNMAHLSICMDKLSDAHHQVIHLTFFEELSYPDIAKTLDCPEGTVKTRIFHARKQLKQCLSRIAGKNPCSSAPVCGSNPPS